MPDKTPTVEDRLAGVEDRLDALEARFAPRKTAEPAPISPKLTGACRDARFARTPEEAKQLAADFRKKTAKK